MSYARWSSDMYRSDVYVYESDAGFEVHVAARRVIFDRDAVGPDPGFVDPGEYLAWRERLMAAMQVATYTPIGLSRDGLSFTVTSAAECAELLQSLSAEGYHVPEGTIEALLEASEPALCQECTLAHLEAGEVAP